MRLRFLQRMNNAMLASEHLTETDLHELLQGEGENDRIRELGRHLHECDQCRRSLESMSAKTDFWQKTPQVLRSAESSGGLLTSRLLKVARQSTAGGKEGVETAEQPQFEFDASEDLGPHAYAMESLLDPPKHPEMLGRVGKYDVEKIVGSGGMGIVFKAHDTELNRPLAIKVLAPHLASNGIARRRFAQEARAAAGVLHPNVIAVHGVNNEGKTPYIVMPYVAGPSLQALIEQNGPLPEIEIVRIALQIAAGLSAAHAQGLVHRDIKPANILVEPEVNRVLITDFGLARCEDDASLTRTGWLTGTPNYMSPEQTRGERPDQRSDLFSFGSLIYFLATGRLPFRADTPLSVLTRIQNEEPKPVRLLGASVSKTLEDIITVMLRKSPDDRFQTAAELHEVLEKHLAHLHEPHKCNPPVVIQKSPSRWLRGAIGFGAMVIFTVGLGMYGFFDGSVFLPTDDFANATVQPPETEGSLVVAAIEDDSESILKDEKDEIGTKLAEISVSVREAGLDGTVSVIEKLIQNEQYPVLDQVTRNLIKKFPNDESAKFYRGYALLFREQPGKAFRLFKNIEHSEKYGTLANYNMACIYAKDDNPDAAFRYLEVAIDKGLCGKVCFSEFVDDEDLFGLHDDPRFNKLVEKFSRLEDEMTASEMAEKWPEMVEESCEECEAVPCEDVDCETNHSTMSVRGVFQSIEMYMSAIAFSTSPMANVLSHATVWDDVSGTWSVHHDGNDNKFLLMRSVPGSKVSSSTSLLEKEQAAEVRRALALKQPIHLDQAAGSLAMKPDTTSAAPKGSFSFQGKGAFRRMLDDNGVRPVNETVLFYCFCQQQNGKQPREVVDYLRTLQAMELSDATFSALVAAEISLEEIKLYENEGLEVQSNLNLLLAHVPVKLASGYKKAGLEPAKYEDWLQARVPAAIAKKRVAQLKSDSATRQPTARPQRHIKRLTPQRVHGGGVHPRLDLNVHNEPANSQQEILHDASERKFGMSFETFRQIMLG